MTIHQKRVGMSLMEVLIAMGILALGMISIMAFFPLGAMNMLQSVRNERSAQVAANADHTMRILWKLAYQDGDGSVRSGPQTEEWPAFAFFPLSIPAPAPAQNIQGIPAWMAMDEPTAAISNGVFAPLVPAPITAYPGDARPLPNGTKPFTIPPPIPNSANRIPNTATTPSWPVMIDPIGWRTRTSAAIQQRGFVAGLVPNPILGGLPRRTLPLCEAAGLTSAQQQQLITRFTTLTDDLGFNQSGGVDASVGQFERTGRYNVAWILQRMNNSVRHEANLKVLVFEGRPTSDVISTEISYTQAFVPGATNVVLNIFGTGRPPLKPGGWVMVLARFTSLSGGVSVPFPVCDFYRVTAITEVGINQIRLDLDNPIKGYRNGTTPPQPYPGNLVIMERLVEVFDRGVVSASGIPAK